MIHIGKIFDSTMGNIIPVWDGPQYCINYKWDIHHYLYGKYDNGNVARNAVYGTACFHIGISFYSHKLSVFNFEMAMVSQYKSQQRFLKFFPLSEVTTCRHTTQVCQLVKTSKIVKFPFDTNC